ncbi:MAG TPA: hypothetical protein VF796_15155 [Humisphaera sp.]
MIARLLVASAAAVYLSVIGFVLTPGCTNAPVGAAPGAAGVPAGGSAVTPNGVKLVKPFRGVAITINGGTSMAPYLTCIDEIAATGADTVQVVVAGRMENGSSTQVFIDVRLAPTREQMLEVFARAKEKGLRVQLMPIVLMQNPRGDEWRGTIKPESWAVWFDSYRYFIGWYAEVAQQGKVDSLVVGSELVSTEVHGDEWKRTIADVRTRFGGTLTYSANWDHYANIPFWDQLDFIGMNSYWKLGKDNTVKVEEIMANWREIQKELAAFSNLKKKPIVLCEAGWCSITNAAHEPWDYTKVSLAADWDLQRRLYEGFFRSFMEQPKPWFGGFMMWEWHPYPIPADDRSYHPKGKPAFEVMKTWMAKPAWELN